MAEKTNRITFKQFSVRKLEFKTNESCSAHSDGPLHVRPNLFWKVATAADDPNEYCVILGCTIFKDDEQAPFEFRLETSGFFTVEEGVEQKELQIFALTNLFPYLSGLVSQTLALVQKNQPFVAVSDIKRLVEEAKPEEPEE